MSRVGTRYHLAVVDGPDGGWVAALPEDHGVVVGRGAEAGLVLDDPAMSRRHLEVRSRRGRLTARALGRGVRWRPGRRRRSGAVVLGRPRRLRGRWRATPPGSRLLLGTSTLEIREHPGLRGPSTAAPQPALGEGLGARLLIPLVMAASMIPMALTSAGSSPWRLITWVALPVVLVLAVLWPWLRERAARRRRRQETTTEVCPEPPDPAALLVTVDAPWRHPETDWDLGTPAGRRAPTSCPAPEPGHGIAVVGDADAARAMARWLLCQAAHRLPPTELTIAVPDAWDWARTLPHTVTANPRTLTVTDLTGPGAPSPAPTAPTGDDIAIVVGTSLTQIPAWCTRVVEAGPRHDRRVGTAWASEVSETLARRAAGSDALPELVPLQTLIPEDDPVAVLARWRGHADGLRAPLGVSATGLCWLDLAAAGPHALVAGTTGSGKSELLTTLVLGLALHHPPADLHVLLVDYKGGATFGALATLPHVTGMLTDLDPAATARALASLRAELARRERALADAGARSIAELIATGGRLPRLLVVVDEFRTLADGHPDLLDSLVRLAAQGRSLGIHLVLATQRPAGAVTADMRANISLRLCLRVLDQTDSLDVVGDTSAAQLPAVPGRAVVRSDVATTVQVAWPGTVSDGVASLVRLVTDAAALAEPALVTASAPWAPPLPDHVPVATLPEAVTALPLLLTDLPHEQRLGAWHLPLGEVLLISGPPGSGRTTAARTLATEAVRRGVVTHTIAVDRLLPPQAPARGTACPPDDVRRSHRLLASLAPTDAGLLVVDDIDALCRSLDDALGYGVGHELVTAALTRARRAGVGVVLTAGVPATRWAALTRRHLVLAPRDLSDALVAGVPRDVVPLGAPPGRGVMLDGGAAILGQVASAVSTGPWAVPPRRPLRLQPLPELVDLPASWTTPGALLVGLGGDTAAPVKAPMPPGAVWLILGGARTGRSTALRMLMNRLAAHRRPVWTDPAAVPEHPGEGVLVMDDVDRVTATRASAAAEAVARGAALIATARPDPLASSYHDLARRLRDPDVTLVLGSPTGTHAWTGTDLRPLADTTGRVGRGVLLTHGVATPLQVDRGGHAVARVLARASTAQMTAPPEDVGRLVAAIDAGSSSPTITTTAPTSTGTTSPVGA